MNDIDYSLWPVSEYMERVYFPETMHAWNRPDVFKSTHRRSLKAFEEMIGRPVVMHEVNRLMVDGFKEWLKTSRFRDKPDLYSYVARIIRHWDPDRMLIKFIPPKPTWKDYVSSWWQGSDPEGLIAGVDRYLRIHPLAPQYAAAMTRHVERFVEWSRKQPGSVRRLPVELRLETWVQELGLLLAEATVRNHRKSVLCIINFVFHGHVPGGLQYAR